MSPDQKDRLLQETRETAERLNKLNAFMATDAFPKLDRIDKDLLYEQQRVMSQYVQILGKRLERAGTQFTHAAPTTYAIGQPDGEHALNFWWGPHPSLELARSCKAAEGDHLVRLKGEAAHGWVSELIALWQDGEWRFQKDIP